MHLLYTLVHACLHNRYMTMLDTSVFQSIVRARISHKMQLLSCMRDMLNIQMSCWEMLQYFKNYNFSLMKTHLNYAHWNSYMTKYVQNIYCSAC